MAPAAKRVGLWASGHKLRSRALLLIVGLGLVLALLVGAVGRFALASASATSCAAVRPTPGWVGTWSTSQIPASPTDARSEAGFHDQTLREVVHPSIGGSEVRVHLSNRYGHTPLIVDNVHVALSRAHGAIDPATNRALTFSGRSFAVIAPGQSATSDPVGLTVPNEATLAVSVYLPGLSGPATWEPGAYTTSYVSSPGNHAAALTGAAYPTPVTAWYFLSGVDVHSPAQIGSVVTLGDSIASGYNSDNNAYATWPEDLARRVLSAEPAGHRVAILNAGIDSNRILNPSNLGASAEDRFVPDVASQTGVRTVILLEGINDIRLDQGQHGKAPLTANELIGGMQDIIAQAHAHGLRIVGATVIPFAGDSPNYTPLTEAIRENVNQWIRTSGAFDGVIDFDRAVRDPSDPARILRADGGPLHPNDAGYLAMANAVNLGLLCP